MMNKLKWILYIIILAFLVFWIVICAKYKMIEIIGSSECIPTYDLSEVETNEQIYSLQVGESLQGISQELSTTLISDHLVTQTEDEVLIANKAGEFITDSIHVYIDKDNSGSLITFDGVVTYLDECEKLYSINDNQWVYILPKEFQYNWRIIVDEAQKRLIIEGDFFDDQAYSLFKEIMVSIQPTTKKFIFEPIDSMDGKTNFFKEIIFSDMTIIASYYYYTGEFVIQWNNSY